MTFLYTSNKSQQRRKLTARFLQQLSFGVLSTLLVATILSAGQPSSGIAPIVLQAGPFPFTPKEFYIAGVVDERVDRKAVAYLLPAPESGAAAASVTVPVDLQGGGLQGVRQFIQQGLRPDTRLRPVIMRLKELKVTETPGTTGRVKGQSTVSVTFELQGDGETIPLTGYKGGIRYDRPASQLDAVEPALRQSLLGALSYFNTWIDSEANTNALLAKEIKVIFSDKTPAAATDTVFYSPDRPLTWNDFTGSPSKPSKYAAAVFPGFSYEGHTEVVQGVLHLYLDLKVYMLPGSSWVKPNSKDAYSLNHEQRHFDIVRLVAERFKQKIRPDILSVADHNSIIQYHYIESFREMNKLQDQYDRETQHGLNEVAQKQWDKRIREELESM